jgi:hypothetical protein
MDFNPAFGVLPADVELLLLVSHPPTGLIGGGVGTYIFMDIFAFIGGQL